MLNYKIFFELTLAKISLQWVGCWRLAGDGKRPARAGALAGSEIRFGLENAFDREYRQHLSENNAAGRTFKLTLARTF